MAKVDARQYDAVHLELTRAEALGMLEILYAGWAALQGQGIEPNTIAANADGVLAALEKALPDFDPSTV